MGLQQFPHQAQPHPAVVRDIAQSLLLVLGGVQARGPEMPTIRYMNMANGRGMLGKLLPQAQFFKDQS